MPMTAETSLPQAAPAGSAGEVFLAFLKLGLSAFGGPIAHVGYFRREFVERRAWLADSQFAQLLTLCQFLPGPASSQLGFAVGLLRAGWAGAISAFVGFTLPSAIMLFALAASLPLLAGAAGAAAIHGLKLVALAVVAQGLRGMLGQLCPDPLRKGIATLAAVVILLAGQAWMQILVIALGAAAGLVLCRAVQPTPAQHLQLPHDSRIGWRCLALYALLLLGLPLLGHDLGGLWAVAAAFYRAGALVFGGGHVVLPLLQDALVKPGWISAAEFLAGYGAAQAVPGPMFSLAAYLGARLPGNEGGIIGAGVAVAMIFLPGFLLLAGVLPLWQSISARPLAARAIAGINAAVVGLLGAALYDPIWISAVQRPVDLAIGLVGFSLIGRVSALLVVAWCVAASLAAQLWL